jgi:acylphosphatase
MKYVELIISGRVQMVRFRVFTHKYAQKLGLIGTVTNKPDGTVYIEAWGEKLQLEKFIQYIKRGSTLSRVDNVSEFWDNKDYIYPHREFRIIH